MLKKLNRGLAMLLALIMVIGTLPGITVFAAGDNEPAVLSGDIETVPDAAAVPAQAEGEADIDEEALPPSGAESASSPREEADAENGDPAGELSAQQIEAGTEDEIMPLEAGEPEPRADVELKGSNGSVVPRDGGENKDFAEPNVSTAHINPDGKSVTIDKFLYVVNSSSQNIKIPSVYYTNDDKTESLPVTRIADNAFAGSDITTVEFVDEPDHPCEIEEIGASAFSSTQIYPSITIPKSVKTLGVSCFDTNKGTKDNPFVKVIFEDGSPIKEIPSECFRNCENLTEIENTPDVTSIGASAFAGCKKLMYFKVPASVTG